MLLNVPCRDKEVCVSQQRYHKANWIHREQNYFILCLYPFRFLWEFCIKHYC